MENIEGIKDEIIGKLRLFYGVGLKTEDYDSSDDKTALEELVRDRKVLIEYGQIYLTGSRRIR